MVENINTGVCQWRVTNNKPAFFVNWTEAGKRQYEFFSMRFIAEQFKNKLIIKSDQWQRNQN